MRGRDLGYEDRGGGAAVVTPAAEVRSMTAANGNGNGGGGGSAS
ncbi:MAG TPA: hypothetical protein VMT47_13445 [Polyangia bacterium]|nr:hypothetical protein [Polyangia bacterium]